MEAGRRQDGCGRQTADSRKRRRGGEEICGRRAIARPSAVGVECDGGWLLQQHFCPTTKREEAERANGRSDYLWTTATLSVRGRPTGSCFRVVAVPNISVCSFFSLKRSKGGRPLTWSCHFISLERRVRTRSGIFVAEKRESVVRLSFSERRPSEMDIALLLMTLAAEQCR